MKYLLIIYRQPDTAESLRKNFTAEGYRVNLKEVELLDFNQFDPYAYDLVIIHLNLDISTGWKTFLNFKNQFPHLPVLLCIRDLYSLKYAVRQALHQKKPSRISGYSRNLFLMPPCRRHLTLSTGGYALNDPEIYLYQNIRYLKWIQWFSRERKTEAAPFYIEKPQGKPCKNTKLNPMESKEQLS